VVHVLENQRALHSAACPALSVAEDIAVASRNVWPVPDTGHTSAMTFQLVTFKFISQRKSFPRTHATFPKA
jgi:hypothetical protein